MDLFTPRVDAAKLHPNFVAVSQEGWEDVREVIAGWSDGFIDRDKNFPTEFQTKFNQQFWELYLHAVFRDAGFCPRYDRVAPDYWITVGGKEVLAEATTTQNASGVTPEWLRRIGDMRPGQNDLMFHCTFRRNSATDSETIRPVIPI